LAFPANFFFIHNTETADNAFKTKVLEKVDPFPTQKAKGRGQQ
jgi:hypothetical protein